MPGNQGPWGGIRAQLQLRPTHVGKTIYNITLYDKTKNLTYPSYLNSTMHCQFAIIAAKFDLHVKLD